MRRPVHPRARPEPSAGRGAHHEPAVVEDEQGRLRPPRLSVGPRPPVQPSRPVLQHFCERYGVQTAVDVQVPAAARRGQPEGGAEPAVAFRSVGAPGARGVQARAGAGDACPQHVGPARDEIGVERAQGGALPEGERGVARAGATGESQEQHFVTGCRAVQEGTQLVPARAEEGARRGIAEECSAQTLSPFLAVDRQPADDVTDASAEHGSPHSADDFADTERGSGSGDRGETALPDHVAEVGLVGAVPAPTRERLLRRRGPGSAGCRRERLAGPSSRQQADPQRQLSDRVPLLWCADVIDQAVPGHLRLRGT